MQNDKIFYDCFLCDRPFQFGPSVYKGRHIPAWGIQICERCDRSNWDGIVLSGHPKLEKHLADNGIKIQLNDKGWLPIPPR